MKRILSLLLCIVLCCLLLCSCSDNSTTTTTVKVDKDLMAETEEETELVLDGIKLYATHIAALNAKNTEYDYVDSSMLCDIDSNGTDELIMVHYSDNVHHHGDDNKFGNAVAFNVKTIENNEVVHLIENEFFYELSENAKGDIYKLGCEKEKCIGFNDYVTTEGENGVMHETGNWQFFVLDGSEFQRLKYIKYSYDYTMNGDEKVINYDSCAINQNGMDVNYTEFERWLESYQPEYLMSSFDEEHSTRTLLDELINM